MTAPGGGGGVHPEADPFAQLTGFGRALRERGLPVGTGRILTFAGAAHTLAPLDRDGLYWAGRATLTSRPEDAAVFDAAFKDYFGRYELDDTLAKLYEFGDKTRVPELEIEAEADEPGTLKGFAAAEEAGGETTTMRMVASAAERLRSKSFEELTDEERAHAAALIHRLEVSLPAKRARRLKTDRRGRRFDLPRTLRMSLRTDGEMTRRAWRRRRSKLRPLVLVLDVSGSMSAYSRALIQFGYAAAAAGTSVEVFCFGTRLTRITRTLKTKKPDEALREVAGTVLDWDGGTRIGESLRRLLNDYGQHVAMRRAVVVLCSDGLDRGDPDLLAAQMARLGRVAYKVIWVNPLKGSPRYQPLARGMAAALPHIDVFLPGHNLASLESLGAILAS